MGALKGVTVVEVSSLVAGPAMGSLLQSLGAMVIKIEPPNSGDPARTVSPWGFLNYNHGKKSLSLNLKSAAGQEILYRLTKTADVFIENMRPGVPEDLGFSYRKLAKLNPRLVYCSVKGFSSESKYHNKPAFDAVAQAVSGLMSLTGEPDGEPLRIGNPAVDLGAAAYGAIDILAALAEREKSGRGRFIEVSLLDLSVYWNGYWLTFYGMTGMVPARLGSGHLGYSPHRVFRTKDNKYVLIAALSDSQWISLKSTLAIPLGSEFDQMKYRLSHRKETEKATQDAVSNLTLDEVLAKLGELLPSAPVRPIDEVYNDEELYSREILRDVVYASSEKKTARIAVSPILQNHTTRAHSLSAPSLGQDNSSVLRSLGYSASEIKKLGTLGVV